MALGKAREISRVVSQTSRTRFSTAMTIPRDATKTARSESAPTRMARGL